MSYIIQPKFIKSLGTDLSHLKFEGLMYSGSHGSMVMDNAFVCSLNSFVPINLMILENIKYQIITSHDLDSYRIK